VGCGEPEAAISDSGGCGEPIRGTWPIDWSGLTTSALGTPLDADDVRLVVVARYELTVTELEEGFRSREDVAAERYEVAVEDACGADLGDAVSETGVAFSGFSGEGVWLLELDGYGSLSGVPDWMMLVEEG
jgi:hypothetical protein